MTLATAPPLSRNKRNPKATVSLFINGLDNAAPHNPTGLAPSISRGGVHDISAFKFQGNPKFALNLPKAGDLFKSSSFRPPKPIFCCSSVR